MIKISEWLHLYLFDDWASPACTQQLHGLGVQYTLFYRKVTVRPYCVAEALLTHHCSAIGKALPSLLF